MDRLTCKACGTESVVPMDVIIENTEDLDELLGSDHESEFYSCHVCGDNWLTIREVETAGEYRITFVHQMGMAPTLKRIAHIDVPTPVLDSERESWEYFLDDEEVEEGTWREKLTNRRKILKSICTN